MRHFYVKVTTELTLPRNHMFNSVWLIAGV